MAETVVCQEVKEKYEVYEDLLDCLKSTSGPELVLSDAKTKKGRPRVMVLDLPVSGSRIGSQMEFVAEMSTANHLAFKFRLSSKDFMSPPLIRYDAKGSAHKNPAKNQRLSEQKVETPHFQKFDNDGELFAYKTDKLKNKAGEQEMSNAKYCIMHFYAEVNMTHDGDLPSLSVVHSGSTQLFPIAPQQIDPNSHVSYFA